MKNEIKRKLRINKDTLRSLKVRELSEVVAAGAPVAYDWGNPGFAGAFVSNPGYSY